MIHDSVITSYCCCCGFIFGSIWMLRSQNIFWSFQGTLSLLTAVWTGMGSVVATRKYLWSYGYWNMLVNISKWYWGSCGFAFLPHSSFAGRRSPSTVSLSTRPCQSDLLCARSSEVLGLTSQLLVWTRLDGQVPWLEDVIFFTPKHPKTYFQSHIFSVHNLYPRKIIKKTNICVVWQWIVATECVFLESVEICWDLVFAVFQISSLREDGSWDPWQKTTSEMIMALTANETQLFARLGQVICAWDHAGQECWQRPEPLGESEKKKKKNTKRIQALWNG